MIKKDEIVFKKEVIARNRLGQETVRDIGIRLGMDSKRVCYLCQKWSDKGWYEYGVSVDLGWWEGEE